MTRSQLADYLDTAAPTVIPVTLTIEHLQLRDILQPSSDKGKCLFLNGSKVEEVDFTQSRGSRLKVWCRLDFNANCLSSGHGLMAAGGQGSEMAIRPLTSATSSLTSDTTSNSASSSSASSSSALPATSVFASAPSSHTPERNWLIRTTTGGSINNAISIRLEDMDDTEEQQRPYFRDLRLCSISSASRPRTRSIGSSSLQIPTERLLQRDEPPDRTSFSLRPTSTHGKSNRTKRTDDYWSSHAAFDTGLSGMTVEEEMEAESLAAAYGAMASTSSKTALSPSFSRLGVRKSHDGRSDEGSVNKKKGRSHSPVTSDTIELPPIEAAPSQSIEPPRGTIRVYVSNNDQFIKVYKLRPPSSNLQNAFESPQPSSLEGGLPGLSREQSLSFTTAINHCSFSPDGQTLIAVGDTPEVFLYRRRSNKGSRDQGEDELDVPTASSGKPEIPGFEHLKTYRATSDACFSSAWHPDGTKFAVASQDGVVSVWDVRSEAKLAEIKTSQSANSGGGLYSPLAFGISSAHGAARVVKFSPCGRFLAFTEHRSYFHIYDTVTYSRGQRIEIPSTPSRIAALSGTEEVAAPTIPPWSSVVPSRTSGGAFENIYSDLLEQDATTTSIRNSIGRSHRRGVNLESTLASLRADSDRLRGRVHMGAYRPTSTYSPHPATASTGSAQTQTSGAEGSGGRPILPSASTVERTAFERAWAEGWRPSPVNFAGTAPSRAGESSSSATSDAERDRAFAHRLPILRAYSSLRRREDQTREEGATSRTAGPIPAPVPSDAWNATATASSQGNSAVETAEASTQSMTVDEPSAAQAEAAESQESQESQPANEEESATTSTAAPATALPLLLVGGEQDDDNEARERDQAREEALQRVLYSAAPAGPSEPSNRSVPAETRRPRHILLDEESDTNSDNDLPLEEYHSDGTPRPSEMFSNWTPRTNVGNGTRQATTSTTNNEGTRSHTLDNRGETTTPYISWPTPSSSSSQQSQSRGGATTTTTTTRPIHLSHRLSIVEEEAHRNLAGLCWDREVSSSSEEDRNLYLYVATERCICRFLVKEKDYGSGWGSIC